MLSINSPADLWKDTNLFGPICCYDHEIPIFTDRKPRQTAGAQAVEPALTFNSLQSLMLIKEVRRG